MSESESDSLIEEIYQRFRPLMPALPEDCHEGLVNWRLLRTTASGTPWDGHSPVGVKADLTFANGLEYHGQILPEDGGAGDA